MAMSDFGSVTLIRSDCLVKDRFTRSYIRPRQGTTGGHAPEPALFMKDLLRTPIAAKADASSFWITTAPNTQQRIPYSSRTPAWQCLWPASRSPSSRSQATCSPPGLVAGRLHERSSSFRRSAQVRLDVGYLVPATGSTDTNDSEAVCDRVEGLETLSELFGP